MKSIVTKGMNIRFMAIMGMLLCLLSLPAMSIELLSPKHQSLFYEPYVSVVVDTNDTLTEHIEIVADGNQSYSLPIIPNKTVYCKKVPLQLGKNHIDVKSYEKKKLILQTSVDVYYTSAVEKAFKYPSKEYTQNFFHTQEKEERCVKCHNMEINETPGVAFEDVTESNCYACHKELGQYKYAHAPSVNWLCTSCHNGKTGMKNRESAGESKYLFPDPIGKTCLSCHNSNTTDKSKIGWEQKRYHHDPAESGRCNRCHNPHSSPNLAHLRKPIWELCVGCHEDKAEGAHVVNTSFVRAKHPTRGVPDPSREGRELSCTSCHNPHASDKPFFLPDNRGNKMICTMCHKK